jgi:tetratricopeptide (TPR) repeat protein
LADNQRIEDLRRRVQKDPASIAFAQLAEEYRRAGQYQESVDACRAGLGVHPGYLSARVTLGRALIELGKLDEALPELELVLKSAPENLAAIRGIADVHHKQQRFGKALEFYNRALGLARNDPDLEQTVAELTQLVTPTRGAEPKDGLSFEQMQREITARMPPPPAVARAAPLVRVPPGAQPPGLQQRTPQPAAPQPAAPQNAAPQPVALQPAELQSSTMQAAALQPPALQPAPLQPPPLQPAPLQPPPQLLASQPDQTGAERNANGADPTVAALEKWLEAINVARANRSA